MKNLKLLPYKMNSLSSKTISRHFGCKRIYPDGKYKIKNGDIIINWGFCGDSPVLNSNKDFTLLNPPIAVDRASDKVKTLQFLAKSDVPHVEFTLDQAEAIKWVEEGNIVYCRTLTRGKEGKGIVLAKTTPEVVKCGLYTKYFKNDTEFRVHVFNGEVIDAVQKKEMSSERRIEKKAIKDESSKYIRNLKKAWSFCREGVVVPEHVQQLAIDAVKALGLDFAGCDIAYNNETGEAKILELNTACGQKRGTTTHLRYTRAISKYLMIPFSIEEYNERYNCNAENYLNQ